MFELFDRISRKHEGPACHAEPQFDYLNRSARPEVARIREVLEGWFSHYPTRCQADLWSRFRSPNDHNHLSALFEIVVHELLTRLKCSVEIHPSPESAAGKRPDFLVQSPKAGSFYAEAVLVTDESREETSARARMNTVYDALDRLPSPDFFVGMKLRGAPETQPPARRMRDFLAEHLAALDPDEIAKKLEAGGLDALPHWRYQYAGWLIDFFPIPKSRSARGKSGVRPLGLRFHDFTPVTTRESVRDAIVSKAGRYGNLDLPYVVAVNVLGHTWDDSDAMEALIGKEQGLVSFAKGEPEMETTRALDGAWTSESGPRNTRVGAALMVTRLTAWKMALTPVRLFHNPWAQRPYTSELTSLPQAVPRAGRMELVNGLELGAILGLPDGWPHEARAP